MLIGLAFGVAVKWLLKWMRRRDAGRDKQICLTLAAAYLSFYVANSPAGVSGTWLVGLPLSRKGSQKEVLSMPENFACRVLRLAALTCRRHCSCDLWAVWGCNNSLGHGCACTGVWSL